MSYDDFLARKAKIAPTVGVEVDDDALHPALYDWQREGVRWALRTGRCALFWDCGLGKTFAQIEWARLSAHTSLIVAPLSVARQTVREAHKINVDVRYVRDGSDVDGPGVWITNYEMVDRFDPALFGAVVLDESSILKNVDGKTRRALTTGFAAIPRRLACTATPAPNDVAELTNHAEFLGVMSRAEMLAAYFVNDEKNWRLKGHAADAMFGWMSTWVHALRSPADMGYPDDDYVLPDLRITRDVVDAHITPMDGQMFATDLGGVGGRANVRRQTLSARVERVVELVNGSARVQPDLERGEPGACARVSARDSGASKPATARAVRERSGTPEAGGRSRGGAAQGQPATEAGTPLRPDGAGARRPADDGMRDLRSEAGEATHRPLPQDGGGARCALPTVQSGGGAHAGRPGAGSIDGPVSDESAWVIWCGLNDEQDRLARALGERALSISGALSPDEKERRLVAWLDGERPILLTKPSICGFGLNLQRAHHMVFLGLGDSYESYYQSIRRCWRFGQTEPVDVRIVVSAIEQQIVNNVVRKEREATAWTDALMRAMHPVLETT